MFWNSKIIDVVVQSFPFWALCKFLLHARENVYSSDFRSTDIKEVSFWSYLQPLVSVILMQGVVLFCLDIYQWQG
jgi:hypothetical protein